MKLTGKARRAAARLDPCPVVVLCRPQLGENVGLVARAMLNFGLHELRLVAPRFGWPNAKAVAACAGAYEVLNRMRIFERLADAIADLHHLYATTARPRDLPKPVLTAEATAAEAASAVVAGRRVGLLFGPERTGLANEELTLADALVTIPLNPAFTSLNLSQAVLILGYEWFRARDRTPAVQPAVPREPPATKGELRALLDHLLRELDATGFFRSPTRRDSLVRAIEVMCERRAPTTAEVNLLHGIVERLAHGRRGSAEADRPSSDGEDPGRAL